MAKRRNVNLDIDSELDQTNEIRKAEFRLLIVCEDQKWEPKYLKFLTQDIDKDKCYIITKGTGRNTLSVVQEALEQRNSFNDELAVQRKRIPKTIEETWVVFDKDSQTIRYSEALELAKNSEPPIKLAVSNEAFELWLLMHFVNINPTPSIPRSSLYLQLDQIFKSQTNNNLTYNHRKFNQKVLDFIHTYGFESNAITRAKALELSQNSDLQKNPITLMHHLVERLKQFALEYPKEA